MSLWGDILNGVQGVTDSGSAEGAITNTADWLASGGPAKLTSEIHQLKVTVVVVGSILGLLIILN